MKYRISKYALSNKRKPKQLEYEDIDLTLHNYKEPLRKVPNGYGYLGTVMGTKDGECIQCHVCGQLFSNLSFHIKQAHGLLSREYKEKFGLAYSTALVSENERYRMKQQVIEWLKNMTPEEKKRYSEENARRLKEVCYHKHRVQPKGTLETANKRGACPDQVLSKLAEASEKLGKTPTKREFIKFCNSQRYVHLIYKIFGSYKEAINGLGLISSEPKKGGYKYYDDEELLFYLRAFTKTNGKVPTHTDFVRGILPSYDVYIRRFGNIQKAREYAGLYEMIESNRKVVNNNAS